MPRAFRDPAHPSPVTWDFVLANFTTDVAEHELDLSNIVPAGAYAVLLNIEIADGQAGSNFEMKHPDHVNYTVGMHLHTHVATQHVSGDFILHIDEEKRRLTYTGTDLTFNSINLVVKGWWIR